MTLSGKLGSIDLGRGFGPVYDQGAEPMCAPAVVSSMLWVHGVTVCVPCLGRLGAVSGDAKPGRTVASCLAAVLQSGAPLADGTSDHSQHVIETVASIQWTALDGLGWTSDRKLDHLVSALAVGRPVALQIGLYGSAIMRSASGWLGVPEPDERRIGLHAVLCVGIVRNETRSGLIIKNSWGTDWGSGGYGIVDMDVLGLPETGKFITLTDARVAPERSAGSNDLDLNGAMP